MMAKPPDHEGSPDPLCKICHKPLKEHSFKQQQECSKRIHEKDP